jgi:hypothetical protein
LVAFAALDVTRSESKGSWRATPSRDAIQLALVGSFELQSKTDLLLAVNGEFTRADGAALLQAAIDPHAGMIYFDVVRRGVQRYPTLPRSGAPPDAVH